MSGVVLRSLTDTVEIAPGVHMPRLGVGTYLAQGPEAVQEVEWAVALGYRLIDTAKAYGNEESIGEGVRRSGLPRDELFITTKLWNYDQGYRSTLAACAESLRRLGTDHIDLYLVHWHVPSRWRDTWRAMEELLAQGTVRAIGVSNHMEEHLEALLEYADVPPAVDQVEHHPRLQQPALREYCSRRGVTMQAWSPLMVGAVGRIPELAEMGRGHGKTAFQVSIRWMLQRGVTTIPKSVHRERLAENADVFDFELSDGEMAAIDALDRGLRIGEDPWTRGDVRARARIARAYGRFVSSRRGRRPGRRG